MTKVTSSGEQNIKALHKWFKDVLKIEDQKMIEKLVNSFCKDKGYKIPTSLRKSGKPKRIRRSKYNFIVKNWPRFVNFLTAYMTLADEIATAQAKAKGEFPEQDNTPDEKSLVNSLISF